VNILIVAYEPGDPCSAQEQRPLSSTTPMNRAAIVVRTANRPKILNRCIAAAIEGCNVAQEAYWIVLDDSSSDYLAATREIAQSWQRTGLRLAYVDTIVQQQITESLPNATLRSFFTYLVAGPRSCPAEGGRNLGLATGLSLNPSVLFFLDDDMVNHHEESCFFHWCVNSQRLDSFIAAPRKRGIIDMTYLNRLVAVLDRDDWTQFVSDAGISTDSDSWHSPTNPFWKPDDAETASGPTTLSAREVVNGGSLALHNNEAEWLPFPSQYNEDLNWSLLQSFCLGTALLKVGGVNIQHLPPSLGHPTAESIVSELVGTAITRALRHIKPRGEETMSTLAVHLPDAFGAELKQELFLLLDVERAVFSRKQMCNTDGNLGATISKLGTTLADVAERLKSIDSRQFANGWLDDFDTRSKMFLELRRNEMVQKQIRGALLEAGIRTL
jgi:hypothetical protein